MIFEKKVTIFKKKDRETWLQIKNALKEAGMTGVHASHYPADSLRPCGCGPRLDPRNFGENGWIDRDVYFIDVRKDDAPRARAVIEEHGIQAIVEEDPIGRLGRI